mmetsp:Transcript_10515/g.32693  ORF Transcript_10515/g.32693 Transcript_10515/m.32693 type:complete len:222 (+) Transcript_10515:148-813(+)
MQPALHSLAPPDPLSHQRVCVREERPEHSGSVRKRTELSVTLPVVQPVIAELHRCKVRLERRVQQLQGYCVTAAAPDADAVQLLRRPRGLALDNRGDLVAEEAPVLAPGTRFHCKHFSAVLLKLRARSTHKVAVRLWDAQFCEQPRGVLDAQRAEVQSTKGAFVLLDVHRLDHGATGLRVAQEGSEAEEVGDLREEAGHAAVQLCPRAADGPRSLILTIPE